MVLAIGKGMTRKDYELIAAAVKVSYDGYAHLPAQVQAIHSVAISLSVALRSDNPRFDSDRFLVACGIPESEINQ
jgi:hypothetical protein